MSTKQNSQKSNVRWFGTQKQVPAPDGSGMKWKWNFPRLALLFGSVGLVTYLVFGAAVYSWLAFGRGIEQVKLWDVLTFQVPAVKRSIAANHLKLAREALAEKNLQAAYLSFISALRGDGTNPAVRLEVADFLVQVGASKQALSVVEEGAKLAPTDAKLVLRLCELLRSQGRTAKMLELLRGPLAVAFQVSEKSTLRLYEAESILEREGPGAALKQFDRHPEVFAAPRAVEVKALALWNSGDQNGALELLREAIKKPATPLSAWIRFFDFLEFKGQTFEALEVAEKSVQRFPKEAAARGLWIAANRWSKQGPSPNWAEAVTGYLRDFGSRIDAVVELAEMAGRRGWFDLTEAIYASSIQHGPGARVFVFAHADALTRGGQLAQANLLLQEIETQISTDTTMAAALRRRQIAVAAAMNAPLRVREYARNLAALFANDPERLETTRRQYEQAGLLDAAAELGGKKTAKPLPASEKKKI